MTLQTKLLAALISLIALMACVLVYGQDRYERGVAMTTDRYEAALASEKAAASKKLATETERVRQAEQALNDFKNSQELQDAQSHKTIADLSDRLRRLAGPSGRLRDPNQAGCGGGGSGSTSEEPGASGDRAADGAEAGGLLSTQLSGLLQQLTREADEINTAYASCRAWLTEVSQAY